MVNFSCRIPIKDLSPARMELLLLSLGQTGSMKDWSCTTCRTE